MSGWLPNSSEDYHSGPGVGSHGLNTIYTKTPAHFKALKESPKDETPAMRLGKLAHAYVLEGKNYDFIQAPEWAKNTIKYKDWLQRTTEERPKGVIVTAEEMCVLKGLFDSVARHRIANHMLDGGFAELSGYSTCTRTSVLRRIRPDYRKPDLALIFDLKTCQDCGNESVTRQVTGSFGYQLQAAYYKDVSDELDDRDYEFIWVFAETKPPYAVRTYKASQRVLQEGRKQYEEALSIYSECVKRDEWPSYKEEIIELDLPAWYRSK